MKKNISTNTFSTIGVEEEFLVVNSTDYSQGYVTEQMLQDLINESDRVDPEIFTSHVETRTPVCTSFKTLKDEIIQSRKLAQGIANRYGLSICASATVPNYDWRQVQALDIPRVKELIGDFSDTFSSQSIAAFHVHTKTDSLETSLQTVNQLNWFVWVFLALSASSPFYDCRYSGVASRRLSLIGQTQRTGFAPFYKNEQDYYAEQNALSLAGWEPNKLWYYLRHNPNHDTVELRVMDAVPYVEDAVALAALFLCMSEALAKGVLSAPDMSDQKNRVLAQVNLERAVCFGTTSITSVGKEVKFFSHADGEFSLASSVDELISILNPIAKLFDCVDELLWLRQIVLRGNSAAEQQKLSETKALFEITGFLVQQTLNF